MSEAKSLYVNYTEITFYLGDSIIVISTTLLQHFGYKNKPTDSPILHALCMPLSYTEIVFPSEQNHFNLVCVFSESCLVIE